MNWAAFLVVAWVFFGAELGLKDALQLGQVGVAPSCVVALLVFVSMSATPLASLTSGLVIGLLLDLTHAAPVDGGGQAITMVGPYSLGAVAGAYAVLVTRGLVMRHNPLTFAFLVFVASLIMNVVAVSVFQVRSWYDPVSVSAGRELLLRAGSAGYSAALALALGPALRLMSAVFGFPASQRARQRVTAVRGR